jgi:hypothetical protein
MRAVSSCISGRGDDPATFPVPLTIRLPVSIRKDFRGLRIGCVIWESRGTGFQSLEEVLEIRFHLQSTVNLQNMP